MILVVWVANVVKFTFGIGVRLGFVIWVCVSLTSLDCVCKLCLGLGFTV